MVDEELLDELRPGAFAIAYRMLGSVSEAEDVVQEALLRLHRAEADGERIESPRAYVSTVVTRLGIDQLRSARRKRETYVGEWLPEPLLTSEEEDPARQAEMADSLSLSFLVLLESLSPEQRAVFLLHDVFDYPYDEVARIVGNTEANTRALATWGRQAPRFGGAKFRRVEVNGQPGAIALDYEDKVIGVIALDIAEGRVQGVRSVVNPDKLHHVGPVADLRALLRRASRARARPG